MLNLRIALLGVFAAMQSWGSDPQSEIRSLQGLHQFEVSIEGLTPKMQDVGLDPNQIRSDVELKLRLAGIKVVVPSFGSDATLYVSVDSQAGVRYPLYAISLSLKVLQDVQLVRDPHIQMARGITWEVHQVGIVSKNAKPVDFVRGGLKDLVDVFLNDYLSANPKK
jgi:hypothetical protein